MGVSLALDLALDEQFAVDHAFPVEGVRDLRESCG
jgi:hypothetical protein